MQRSQPSHRPSANSLTLVPVGTTEYIAAGDSQAAVPYPSVRRDFDLQWKMLHVFPVCCYSSAVTTGKRAFRRRALRRPHPARREVPCGDTDMDWPRPGAVLHTTGPWGRSYLGVFPWGKPYRGRIHVWDYPKGIKAIRTPSRVQGLTGDPGEQAQVLGLASDCSAQSDCRGCWRTPPGFAVRRTELEEKTGARIPGWGGMAQQAWHQPVLPATYLFPNTREETGSTRRL